MGQDNSLDADDSADMADWAGDLTYREAHLFIEGFFDGFRQVDPRYGKQVQGRVAGDSWYYKSGFVAGWVLKAILIGTGGAAVSGLDVLGIARGLIGV